MCFKNFFQYFVKETLLVFILGMLPVLLFITLLGENKFISEFESFMPNDFTLKYFIILTLFNVLYLLLVAKFPPSSELDLVSRIFIETYKEIRSIFRMSAGFLLAFVIIWLIHDSQSIDLRAIWFLVVGILAITEAVLFTIFSEWLDDKLSVHIKSE